MHSFFGWNDWENWPSNVASERLSHRKIHCDNNMIPIYICKNQLHYNTKLLLVHDHFRNGSANLTQKHWLWGGRNKRIGKHYLLSFLHFSSYDSLLNSSQFTHVHCYYTAKPLASHFASCVNLNYNLNGSRSTDRRARGEKCYWRPRVRVPSDAKNQQPNIDHCNYTHGLQFYRTPKSKSMSFSYWLSQIRYID